MNPNIKADHPIAIQSFRGNGRVASSSPERRFAQPEVDGIADGLKGSDGLRLRGNAVHA